MPHTSTFAGQLTGYITKHTKISTCLSHPRSQINLLPTPPNTPRSAPVSRIHVRRSTYYLHHQTHQDQHPPRGSTFADQLTTYTTRHTKISTRLAYPRSQLNLLPTPPNTLRSAPASHIHVCRSTYLLHPHLLVLTYRLYNTLVTF
jgi:hypothetical protein